MDWAWTFHPHIEVWILCAAAIGTYWWAIRRLGPARATGPAATSRQIACFVAGVAAIFVSATWPIHDLAERSLYSVHMVQHMIITLIAPPLLLLGTPAWMARALLPPPVLRVVRTLSRPLIALVVFNVVIVFTHWPALVNASVRSEAIHLGIHVVLFTAAMFMWMPVVSPILEIRRLSYPGQIGYLFLQSLVPTVPASFLTFGDRPLYRVYEAFARPWDISAISDQRTAGLIMKIVGGFYLWGIITALFFKWATMEREDGVDALAFRDLDRTMDRMELTKR